MSKKHTMPSRLIELEHELSAALIKVDDQRELLRLAKEENEEKRKDIVYLATEKAKLEERIKRLEDSYAAKDQQLSNLLHICRDNDIEVSSYDLIHGKEAKL